MTPLRALSLLSCLSLMAACATDDSELARRVRGMQAGAAAEISDPTVPIELKLADGATTWCPGSSKPAQLRAIVHTKDATLMTPVRLRTAPPGYLPQTNLDVTVSPGGLGPDWLLVGPDRPADLLALVSRPAVTISGHLKKPGAVTSTLQLTATFDCDQRVEFAGRPGRAGEAGGRRGEPGERGLDVAVAISYVRTPSGGKLALVKASPSSGGPLYLLLAPGRKLEVDVRGGDGGAGGIATVSDVRLTGGLGGDGGDGGQVLVTVDPHFPELRSVVTVVNPGGRGGAGGSHDDLSGGHADPGRPGRPGPAARYQNEEPEKSFREELEGGVPIVKTGSKAEI